MNEIQEFLIVDGHSMIFAWPELTALHEKRMILAREALADILTRYQDSTDKRVVLVFDGSQEKMSNSGDKDSIQIIYSKQTQTADDVIERLAAKYAKTHRITVCSNDRMIHQTVESFGAVAISANQLEIELRQAESDLQDQLRKYRS